MNPKQSMQVYLGECATHAAVLDEGLTDIGKFPPLTAQTELGKRRLIRLCHSGEGRNPVFCEHPLRGFAYPASINWTPAFAGVTN